MTQKPSSSRFFLSALVLFAVNTLNFYDRHVPGALTEPILLGGAPRSVAILNGTLAAAVGLGLRLWIAGLLLWLIGHGLAVWAARRDPLFVDVVRRHHSRIQIASDIELARLHYEVMFTVAKPNHFHA